MTDHSYAKLLLAYPQAGRIKYNGISNTQINRNHQLNGAALLTEPHRTYNVEDQQYRLLTEGADVDEDAEIDPTQRAARSEGPTRYPLI